jgi:hypothetical protein
MGQAVSSSASFVFRRIDFFFVYFVFRLFAQRARAPAHGELAQPRLRAEVAA